MPRNLSDTEVAEFRQRLCQVAERRFAERGADGVSMRQLAQELGCSATTPYRYFADKDAILAAVRAAAFDRFAAALEAACKAKGDARAQSRAVGEAYVRFAFAEPNAYRLMFDLTQPGEARYPELARATARARLTMQAHVKTLVAEGIQAGDPGLLGYVYWAALHGLVVLQLAGKLGGAPDFKLLHDTMNRLFARGAAPQADAAVTARPQRKAAR